MVDWVKYTKGAIRIKMIVHVKQSFIAEYYFQFYQKSKKILYIQVQNITPISDSFQFVFYILLILHSVVL